MSPGAQAARPGQPVVIEAAILDERQYQRICELVRRRARIELGNAKRQLCQTRLLRRLKALGIPTFKQYLALLDDPDALTTAIDTLLASKPHLASRTPRGDVGQGSTGASGDVDLAALLRAGA